MTQTADTMSPGVVPPGVRIYAIGDIHGQYPLLQAMHRAIRRDAATGAADRVVVIHLGDYIDRGGRSSDVVELLSNDPLPDFETVYLRGNHEAFMLDYLDHGAYELWHVNGGLSTLRSYAADQQRIVIPDAHEQFVRNTHLYYQTDDFFFVHAGLKPNLPIAENLERYGEDVFLWERSHLKAPELAWEKTVVCGHTPRPEPVNRDRLIAIDTGCVYFTHPQMGRLTAVRPRLSAIPRHGGSYPRSGRRFAVCPLLPRPDRRSRPSSCPPWPRSCPSRPSPCPPPSRSPTCRGCGRSG